MANWLYGEEWGPEEQQRLFSAIGQSSGVLPTAIPANTPSFTSGTSDDRGLTGLYEKELTAAETRRRAAGALLEGGTTLSPFQRGRLARTSGSEEDIKNEILNTTRMSAARKARLLYQEGGAIPSKTKGDTVPILAEPDEYVIPRDVVLRKGTDFFDRLIEKTRQPEEPAKAGYSTGGTVKKKAKPDAWLEKAVDNVVEGFEWGGITGYAGTKKKPLFWEMLSSFKDTSPNYNPTKATPNLYPSAITTALAENRIPAIKRPARSAGGRRPAAVPAGPNNELAGYYAAMDAAERAAITAGRYAPTPLTGGAGYNMREKIPGTPYTRDIGRTAGEAAGMVQNARNAYGFFPEGTVSPYLTERETVALRSQMPRTEREGALPINAIMEGGVEAYGTGRDPYAMSMETSYQPVHDRQGRIAGYVPLKAFSPARYNELYGPEAQYKQGMIPYYGALGTKALAEAAGMPRNIEESYRLAAAGRASAAGGLKPRDLFAAKNKVLMEEGDLVKMLQFDPEIMSVKDPKDRRYAKNQRIAEFRINAQFMYPEVEFNFGPLDIKLPNGQVQKLYFNGEEEKKKK